MPDFSTESDRSGLEFETGRLKVRRLSDGDEALFCALYTDAETMRFIGKPLSPERAARSFRRTVASWHDDPLERVFLAVVDKGASRTIGVCAISEFDTLRKRAEVGIMLASGARSRGFAREGLGGLVQQTYSMFPVDEIWVRCSALNPVVERMVSSIGFALREAPAIVEGPLSQRIWSVRRSSWCSINAIN